MTKGNDYIKFESRKEIDDIANALEKFIKEHPGDDGKESIRRMIDLLDAIYMSW